MVSGPSIDQTDATRALASGSATPLEAAPLEVLLEEARSRYRSEHEKFNQTYARSGIYLGVVAIYVNVLARFMDRPPPAAGSWVLWLFRCSVAGLLLAVAGSASCIVGAILGRAFGYIPEPSSWITFINQDLRPFLIGENEHSAAGTELSLELRRQTLDRYAKAIDINVRVNRVRSAWLHRCSYLILLGLMLGVLAAATYAWLSLSAHAPYT